MLRRAVVCLALLAACSAPDPSSPLDDLKQEIRAEFPEVEQLSTRELAAWLDDPSREPPLLLDAREPEEYAVSHLAGAVLAPSIEAVLPTLQATDSERPIVVYCSVGYRSSRMARALREAGFEQAVNLEGSIFEWATEGREVQRDGRLVREVHPYDEEWGALLPRELWQFSAPASAGRDAAR